jgi:hypothetical protein
VTTIAAVIFFLTCTALPLYAQWFPKHFNADTSFRVECLFSNQTLGHHDDRLLLYATNQHPQPTNPYTVGLPNPIEELKVGFNNSLFVLDGMVELTPVPAVSSRLRGSVSVLNPNTDFTFESPVPILTTVQIQTNPTPPPYEYDNVNTYSYGQISGSIKPQFWFWEVAGLYNLSYEDVYRYSIVAGYRQESWSYQPSNDDATNSYLRDDFTSQIPFIGLQTVMNSPTWKARFEVLGSPFMTKKVAHTARDQGEYMQLDGSLTQGGFIELQMDGNINVTPNALMGVYAQYSYEQLKGELTGSSKDGQNAGYFTTSYNFYTLKSIWTLGLSGSILF